MRDTPENLFHDLRPIDFPFVIEMLNPDTGAVVWDLTVGSPGVITIPSCREIGDGRPVGVRLRFPEGRWIEISAEGMQTGGHS